MINQLILAFIWIICIIVLTNLESFLHEVGHYLKYRKRGIKAKIHFDIKNLHKTKTWRTDIDDDGELKFKHLSRNEIKEITMIGTKVNTLFFSLFFALTLFSIIGDQRFVFLLFFPLTVISVVKIVCNFVLKESDYQAYKRYTESKKS